MFPCMLHACYMENYMHATCIQNFKVKKLPSKSAQALNYSHRYVYTYRCRGGVALYSDVEIQNEYLYDVLSVYSFLTCSKHDILQCY